jgi:ADP-ribosylation factor protein 1
MLYRIRYATILQSLKVSLDLTTAAGWLPIDTLAFHSGKSTIVNVTKFGKDVTIIPIINPDSEIISINNISILAMEEGGRSGSRALRPLYYRGTSGLIFVVDSNNREVIDVARDELHELSIEKKLRKKPILIFANKQDLSNSMTLDELHEKLNLTKLNENTKWHLQSACAIQDEGLHEGFEWLLNSMVEKVNPIKPIIETLDDMTTMKQNLMSMFSMDHFRKKIQSFFHFQ